MINPKKIVLLFLCFCAAGKISARNISMPRDNFDFDKIFTDYRSFPARKNTNPGDTIQYTNRISVNFITALFYCPHIDIEHRINKNTGLGLCFFVRPPFNQSRGILRMFDNPDYQMTGGGFFIDVVHYYPVCKQAHYWSTGLRCGYRNLSGGCAIGTNIYEPDYYVKRSVQELITAVKASFVMPRVDAHVSLDWFITAGGRVSFYNTKFPDFTNYHPESTFTYPKTGCYVLWEFTGGLEIGIGW